jgi:hypothetical protein
MGMIGIAASSLYSGNSRRCQMQVALLRLRHRVTLTATASGPYSHSVAPNKFRGVTKQKTKKKIRNDDLA